MPAKFTAHEAIIMGKAGEEWFTIDDRHLKKFKLTRFPLSLHRPSDRTLSGSSAEHTLYIANPLWERWGNSIFHSAQLHRGQNGWRTSLDSVLNN